MSNWVSFPERRWTPIGSSISGSGAGVGPYSTSYALEISGEPFINGRISAGFRLNLSRPLQSAGVLCRADNSSSFVALYVTNTQESVEYSLRLAVFKLGVPVSVIALSQPVRLDSGQGHFQLQFFSGEFRGTVSTSDHAYSISQTIPEVAFPGYAGVVRFYDSSVLFQRIQVETIGTRPVLSQDGLEEKATGHEYTVFLSHASGDKEAVRKVTGAFRDAGITYWIDEEQITFGDPIVAKIEEGLQNSRYVVVCLSAAQTKHGWIRAEYGPILYREFSGQTARRVIPLTLDGALNPDSIPLLLSDKLRADFTNPASFSSFLEFLQKADEG